MIVVSSEMPELLADLLFARFRILSVIVVSSEMPELLGLCDRILVMREGRIVGEVRAPR